MGEGALVLRPAPKVPHALTGGSMEHPAGARPQKRQGKNRRAGLRWHAQLHSALQFGICQFRRGKPTLYLILQHVV